MNDDRGERRPADYQSDHRGASRFPNRRKQADWVVNGASILSVISWLVAFGAFLVFEFATRRDSAGLLDVYTEATGPRGLQYDLLPYALILLIVAVFMCVVAFIFNAMRMKRKTDKYRKSIIIIGAITVAGLIAFLLRFGGTIFG